MNYYIKQLENSDIEKNFGTASQDLSQITSYLERIKDSINRTTLNDKETIVNELGKEILNLEEIKKQIENKAKKIEKQVEACQELYNLLIAKATEYGTHTKKTYYDNKGNEFNEYELKQNAIAENTSIPKKSYYYVSKTSYSVHIDMENGDINIIRHEKKDEWVKKYILFFETEDYQLKDSWSEKYIVTYSFNLDEAIPKVTDIASFFNSLTPKLYYDEQKY